LADSIDTTQTESQPPEFDDALPEGGHALEVAARAGFGPLSSLAQEVWHGQSVPCVSCGQLVHRDATGCEHCGQDLSEEMIQKMRQHAGPWFVLEHLRPFPGVSLERVIRQIRRGLISETSIVRGPSNDYQWRFAVETPGLCRYFGKCWCCHAEVTLSDAYCAQCLHYLSFEKPRATMQVPGGSEPRPAEPAVTSSSAGPRTATIVPPPAIPARPLTPQTANRQSAIGDPTSTIQPPPSTANQPSSASTSRAPESPDLARLSAVVRQARAIHRDSEWDAPPKVGGVSVAWIAALLIVGAIVALLLISRARSDRSAGLTSPSLPTMSAPVSPPKPVTSVPAPTSATTTSQDNDVVPPSNPPPENVGSNKPAP
jgi:hypothetical protein